MRIIWTHMSLERTRKESMSESSSWRMLLISDSSVGTATRHASSVAKLRLPATPASAFTDILTLEFDLAGLVNGREERK